MNEHGQDAVRLAGERARARLGGVLAGMVARVASEGEWRAWARQVERAGHCARPVRIAGSAAAVDAATGEVRAAYASAAAPDGVLLVPCGDRRASVCPPCAARYRADTWHVIAAGLRGRAGSGAGDAVPESVAGHPAVLATFTAPSFGAVHRASGDGPCRERRGRPRCPHGVPGWCDARHGDGDVLVGRPLCWDCYAYADHVLWHAAVPELWRRTVIYVYRALARLATERTGSRVSVRAVRSFARVSYVKVAEYQRRGAVHLHAVIRLDGVDTGDPGRVVPPPAWADAGVLASAVCDAAGRVVVPLPEVGGDIGRSLGGARGRVVRAARWGGQLDVRTIDDPARVAGYLAKYATKSAGDLFAGLPSRAFGSREVDRISRKVANPHVMLLVLACLRLSRRPECAGLRLDRYVHTLGYRGHFATKSRWYSVTLRVLRGVRRAWRVERAARSGRADPWALARAESAGLVLVGDWAYAGSGWARAGDADLAASLARDHAAAREASDLAVVVRVGEGS